MYPQFYHAPLEPWLKEFTIKVGGQDYKPYDPTAAQRIADQMGLVDPVRAQRLVQRVREQLQGVIDPLGL